MLLEKIFPGLINQKTKFLVKNHGLKKYVKTIIYGVIIPTLFQVRRIYAMQNLFQANMLFPTIFGIKIRNLVFFLHTKIMFFLSFCYIQSPNNLKLLNIQFLTCKTENKENFKYLWVLWGKMVKK